MRLAVHTCLFLGVVTAETSDSAYGKKYKFLVYSPQMANSHVNFMGKISDVLVDAGHDVTMISPIIDSGIGTHGTKKAKVIELPQSEHARVIEAYMTKFQGKVWTQDGIVQMFTENWNDWKPMIDAWELHCNVTVHFHGMLEKLRKEKFDVAYTEGLFGDFCAFGIFYLAGIKNIAVTLSMAVVDGGYYITQTPSMPSYVPSMMSGSNGDKMTFLQRFSNSLPSVMMDYSNDETIKRVQRTFEALQPGFPQLKDIAGNTSLVFMNSEPLVDFPRITSHRIIDIGGIIINGQHRKLDETWSAIMDLRPRTILLSFGTVAKSYRMPEEYKTTIRETLAKFPDVTFIWKYEKPEHNVTRGVPNIVESTWVPQVDMLYDPRLTAFITHCGQGSLTEANMAGVPLLVLPMGFDQLRNAQQVRRNGVGVMLDKSILGKPDRFEEAISDFLKNESTYRANAKRVAEMLHDRPFKMRDIFVKNMEFLARYGPLRQLDHEGRNMGFLQFYLLDVFAFLALIVFTSLAIVIGLVLFFMRRIVRLIRKGTGGKKKNE